MNPLRNSENVIADLTLFVNHLNAEEFAESWDALGTVVLNLSRAHARVLSSVNADANRVLPPMADPFQEHHNGSPRIPFGPRVPETREGEPYTP